MTASIRVRRFAAFSLVASLFCATALAEDVVDPVDPLEDQALAEEAAAHFDKALDTFKQAVQTAVDQAGQGGEGRERNLARAEVLLEKVDDLTETTSQQSETRKFLDGLDATKLGPVLEGYVRYERARLAVADGDTAAAEQLLAGLGLVREWWVLGPFDNERGSGFKKAGPAETGIELDGSWKGKIRQVAWRKVPVAPRFGYVDLDALLRPNDQCFAYAVAFVKSDAARDASLRLGSDEAVKAWVNGQEVLSRDIRREMAFDQDVVGCKLAAGWNTVLLKVHDQTGSWGFRLRLTGADGAPIEGLTYAATREDADAALAAPPVAEPFSGDVAGGAKAFLDQAATSGSPTARDLFHLGWLHYARRFDAQADRQAENLLKRAVELDPKNAIYRFHFAEAAAPPTELSVEKEENKQRMGREKALEIDPEYAVAYRALANYYTSSLVNLERAESLIRKALAINPDFVEARLDLADILERRGLTAQAQIERDKALADPRAEKLERLARERAVKLQSQRRATAAIDAWKHVLALDARSNDARRRLVELAVAALERDDALALLDAVISLNPFDNGARQRKAELLEGAGDFAGARKVLGEALSVCPEDDGLLQALGRVERKAGDDAAALATLRRALDVNPKLQEVERYVNFLDPESAPFEDAYVVDVGPLIEQAKTYENTENHPYLYLLDQVVTKANPDGTASRYARQTIKILNDNGVKQYQNYFARGARPGQAFKWKETRVVRADGSIVEGKKQDSRGWHMANFPALSVGDVVDVAYRADDRAPTVFGDYFGDVNYFADQVPMRRSTYTLITPAERTFYFHQRNLDVQPVVTLSDDGKERVYSWTVENSPEIKSEQQMPDPGEIYPQVQVSTYESWDAFANWWWSMIRDQYIASDEIKAKVAELVEGKETRFDKIRAIYDFVTTDITYQAWPFGPHGYKPYTTTAIFDKKEGDCKDKAILINTMLREIGVEAFPVLIKGEMGRSEEDLELAMVGHFNHCISYVPDVDGTGRSMFLDGTANYHSVLLPPGMDRGAEVVVITPHGAERKTVPIGTADDNGLDQSWEFDVHADGSATAKGELTFRGDGAVSIRRGLSVPGQRPIMLQGFLSRMFGKIELKDNDFDDLKDLSTTKAAFRVTFEIASFAKPDGGSFVLPSSFLDGFPAMSGMASRPERDYDMILGNPQLIRLDVKYVLPEGWTVESTPGDADLSHKVGSFHSKAGQEGNVLTLERTLRLDQTRVSKADYPSFRETLNQLSSVSGQNFKVKPSGQ